MLKLKKWILFSIVLACNYCFADIGILKNYIPDAEKVGSGNYKFLFFNVFTATTYAPMGKLSLDKPFALQLRYARDLKGEDIAKKAIEKIRGQSDKVSEDKLDLWQSELSEIIPNVSNGTVLTGVLTKEHETLFFDENWQLLGRINDKEFANHFFGIWLGKDSSDTKLRKQLFGDVNT